MAIPHDLQRHILQCQAFVARSPSHTLNLGRRECIYAALGPHRHAAASGDDSGRIRRVALALLALERVAPLWDAAWPKDSTLQELLGKIRRLQAAPPPRPEELDAECERYWEYVTALTDETRNIAGVVGMAAVEAYSLAISDRFMSDDQLDPDRGDGEDFLYHDLHFYAACAYADGPPYPIALSDRFAPQRSAAFWGWWLADAVPTAWAAAPPRPA